MNTLIELLTAYWPELLGLLLIVALIVLFVWLRRRQSALQTLPAGALIGAWRRFLGALPREARAHARRCQPFVVLSDGQARVQALIGGNTDWQDKVRQHYPSATVDRHLRAYLASHQVVVELSPALVAEPSSDVRRALLRLWGGMGLRRAPHVLLVLDAATLELIDTDALSALAVRWRGQVALIERATGFTPRVQLVLHDLVDLPGGRELARVLRDRGVELRLPLDETFTERARALKETLPLALTGSVEFRGALAFLEESERRWIAPMGRLLEVLQRPDPLLGAVSLGELTLSTAERELCAANPFTVAQEPARPWTYDTLWHSLGAAAVAASLGVFPMMSFWSGRELIEADLLALADLNRRLDAPVAQDADVAPSPDLPLLFETLPDCDANLGRGALARALTPADPAEARCLAERSRALSRQQQALRERFLEPALSEAATVGDVRSGVLALTLTLATPGSALGALAATRPEVFASALKVGGARMSVEQVVAALARGEAPKTFPSFRFTGGGYGLGWGELASRVGSMSALPWTSPADVTRLEREAEALLDAPFTLSLYDALVAQGLSAELAARGLDRDTVSPGAPDGVAPQDLPAFLELVATTSVCDPADVAATVSALVDQVASCVRSRHVEETEWDLGVLTVRPAAWEGLVSRTGGYAAYADFVAQGGGEGWPWMSAPPAPVVVQMSGVMLTVPGAYTRTAFESSVLPTLAGAAERLDAAGVEGPLRRVLDGFIDQSLQGYATRYAGAWTEFYQGLSFRSRDRVDVEMELQRWSGSAGPLLDALGELAKNTRLGGGGEGAAPPPVPMTRALSEISSVAGLVGAEGDDPASGPVKDYLALLQELAAAFAADRVAVAADEPPAALIEALDQNGQLTLAWLETNEGHEARARAVLTGAGVPPMLHGPLLTPFPAVYAVGAQSVSDEVTSRWRPLRDTLERLTSRYPFNRSATDEVDVGALTATLGPEGSFWADFEAFIAPAAERVGGRWRGRGASGVRVRLPSDLPDTVASLEALRAALWDEKGEPVAIPLRVRSCALPPVALEGYVATEARLSIGFSQVRAYNQRAEALELPFDWWWAPEASLSLSLQPLNQAEASARPLTTTGGASRWAVLRLLDRSAPSDDARCPDGLAWSWSRVSGDPAASVGFVFETDPRAVFNVQLPDDAVGGAP